nr:MAG: terminase large subunit [Caudoviricetes sp.]UYL16911.1 MAG: terminase large subunit [Caudoviricetes sp.]
MSETLVWEEMTPAERLAVKALSKHNFETFLRVWFSITQGQKYVLNWHHRYLCRIVDEIISGERKDTIINCPPGGGKTEITSIHFPVYSLVKLPKVRNLSVSFSDSLVKRNSKRVRDLIRSPEFQSLFPSKFGTCKDDEIQVLDDSGKVVFESISKAIGSQITGSRGGYITDTYSGAVLLDDIEKPDDMFSKVRREAVHMLLKNTIRSRRASSVAGKATPIIAIQQRLHVNDSTYFMGESNGMGIDFDIIKIPAIVTEDYINEVPDWLKDDFKRDVLSGKFIEIDGVKHYSYYPQKESIDDLISLQNADPYTFASQYLQEPVALGGNMVDVDWFVRYGADNRPPLKYDYRFITADTALTTKSYSDFSVFQLWGVKDRKIYLLDMVRGKYEAPELQDELLKLEERARATSKTDGILRKIIIEKKASGIGLIQSASRFMRTPIEPFIPDTDKVTRVLSAMPQIRAGNVCIPTEAPWLTSFLSEFSAFTADMSHKHDDIVDTATMAINCELNLADDPKSRMLRLAGIK